MATYHQSIDNHLQKRLSHYIHQLHRHGSLFIINITNITNITNIINIIISPFKFYLV